MINNIRKLGLIVALVGASVLLANPATAQLRLFGAAQSSASNYVNNQPGVSASQAAAAARSKVGGRVISVKPRKGGNGYRVRMLVDGERVVTVSVDSKGKVKE